MEDDIDPNIIKNTQLSLGKYVKRPPLSDKLLRKPPFRFLHDIVTSVLKSKGFFEGLFDENELISENVKDRESKILFLNKVISVVSLTTGKSLSVKPSKIVAGQEPVKTNELLQCLAHALDNNLSSDEAVKQLKSGETKLTSKEKISKESVKTLKRNTESKKLASRSSEKLGVTDKIGQSLHKSKNKDFIAHKKESPPKKPLVKQGITKTTDRPKEEKKRNNANENISITQKPSNHIEQNPVSNENDVIIDKELSSNDTILQSDTNIHGDLPDLSTRHPEEQPVLDVDENISKAITVKEPIGVEDQLIQFENSKDANINDNHEIKLKSDEIKHDDDEKPKNFNSRDTSDTRVVAQMEQKESEKYQTKSNVDIMDNTKRPTSVRPSSSRPGAPRIKDKSENMLSDTENTVVGKVNIISENTLHEEEENTSIIIENKTEDLYETLQNQHYNNNSANNQNSHLVQQILDSQREFSQISGKTEIEWQFETQKAPNIFMQEMEQLKFSVQALSRIANPLGKLLDHIQEDVEVMRQELQQWTKVYDEASQDLMKQKIANDEGLIPFHTKLTQLSRDIEERHEKITDLKISIHKNSLRIEKLLTNGIVQ